MQEQERTVRKGHTRILESMFHLGRALYQQKKNSEAEKVFRQSVQEWERLLGPGHNNTLSSKYWLGRTLTGQEKYDEAEEVLRQVVDLEGRVGEDYAGMTESKFELGRVLHWQNKNSEAEEVLRQTVQEFEISLGPNHNDTLSSKYWLGITLYNQKKYPEAEEVLRQTVQEGKRLLGPDHKDTLSGMHWLGVVLYEQKKYDEAEEVLQEKVHVEEREVKKDQKDMLDTVRLLQELPLKTSLILPPNNTQEALAGRLNSFFSENQGTRELYTDSEINEISTLLKHSDQRWSRVPRTYVVLRTIGHLNLLDKLINVGFSDYWFPVTERSLPSSLLPDVRALFASAQSLVLTKSMDLEKGEKGQHCYYKQGESPPFETKGVLGVGGFGEVDKVLSLTSLKEYARKRVIRGLARRKTEDIKLFVAEIEILKRLKHHHIVELIGSYTDMRCIGLIMSPVADMDLGAYLTRTTISNHPELRTFFGCLATALEYLHEHKVRHKDIKPNNILVHHGNILLADFGLSFDFTDASDSKTTGVVNGKSSRYCAPEVALEEPRNTTSDIWSLGVVFLEMVVVLKGKTAQDLDTFLEQHGSRQKFIRTNLDALPELVAKLEGIGNLLDNQALGWTQQMLLAEQRSRLTASLLVATITATGQEEESMSFCGICCVSSDDFFDCVDDESFA